MEALPTPSTFLAFALVSLGMVCSPGPNMIYLVSRSIAQGRKAGLVSLLPQFVDPERGAVLAQSLALGLTQITVSLAVNACIVLGAGSLALMLARRPIWSKLQRWFMATVLGLLAVRLATERERP